MSELLSIKKSIHFFVKLGIFVATLAIVIYIFYSFSDKEGKDSINQAVSTIGIGQLVIPWVERAEIMTRKLVQRNSQIIANAIQGICHPTGKSASISKYNISKLNAMIMAEITVQWRGGFTGKKYYTTVVWELNEANHVISNVTFDTAPTDISKKNKKILNEYFRTKLYPVLFSDMGG